MASDTMHEFLRYLREKVQTYLGLDPGALLADGGLMSWSGILGLVTFLVGYYGLRVAARNNQPTVPPGDGDGRRGSGAGVGGADAGSAGPRSFSLQTPSGGTQHASATQVLVAILLGWVLLSRTSYAAYNGRFSTQDCFYVSRCSYLKLTCTISVYHNP